MASDKRHRKETQNSKLPDPAASAPADEQPPRAWLAAATFGLLSDYYLEVPGRAYGSGFTRENVEKALASIRPDYLVVYAKGHSGRTSYDCSLRTRHPMLSKDMPAFCRELTRKAGMRLFLYFSGLIDGTAANRHPEWQMRKNDGSPWIWATQYPPYDELAGLCPQSRYVEEWLSVQVREIMSYDPDGVWVDGDWAGPCFCETCMERYRLVAGTRARAPLNGDDLWRYETQVWRSIIAEYVARLRDMVLSHKPSCAIVGIPAITDLLTDDYRSPYFPRYYQSYGVRQGTESGRPYGAILCDTYWIAEPSYRCRTKTLQRMLQEAAGTLANGGQVTYWTYPMPDGALIPSRIRMAATVADFVRARRDVAVATRSVRWTAILDLPGKPFEGSSLYAAKALIHLHRSPDMIRTEWPEKIEGYDLVVLPDIIGIEPSLVAALDRYVRGGGTLLAAGTSILTPELQRLCGVRATQSNALREGHVFLHDGRTAGIYSPWHKVELEDAEELYPLYRSWDGGSFEMRRFKPNYMIDGTVDEENPEPAGFAAATVRHLDKGTAVLVPANLFGTYRDGYPDVLAWIRELLERLQPRPLFSTDAWAFIEVALRSKGERLLLHLVNGNPGRDLSHAGSNDFWVDDIPPVGPIRCRVRSSRVPQEVFWEPDHLCLDFTFREDVLEFSVPRLEIHGCVAIQPWAPPAVNGMQGEA